MKLRPYVVIKTSLFIFSILLVQEYNIYAAESDITNKRLIDCDPSGPYCGIFCVYSYFKITNIKREIDINTLIDKKYVGSEDGSNIFELVSSAKSLGLDAVPFTRLDHSILKTIKTPGILHVLQDPYSSTDYDHYVLFLGFKGNYAMILDPPYPIRYVSTQELLLRWDGNGLFISENKIDENKISNIIYLHNIKIFGIIFFIFIGIGTLLIIGKNSQYLKIIDVSLIPFNTLLLLSISTFVGIIYHACVTTGMLYDNDSLTPIRENYYNSYFRYITKVEFENNINDNTSVIIDARYPTDYNDGHVKNSVNIYPSMKYAEIEEILKDIDTNDEIIIYCQSRTCPFSNQVSEKLINLGYLNINIYKGGWNEWSN